MKSVVKSAVKKICKSVLIYIRRTIKSNFLLPYKSVLLLGSVKDEECQEIIRRYQGYCPGMELPAIKDKLSPIDVLSGVPVLLYKPEGVHPLVGRLNRSVICGVNHRIDAKAAWNWCRYLQLMHGLPSDERRKESQSRFLRRVSEIEGEGLNRAYLFGTGKSLEKAIGVDFSDGYRIVCNTIVKDPELWHHLKPHFIVAADAIYHFGLDDYAVAFRNDLRRRLSEGDAYFVYPELFDAIVVREFAEFSERLLPIPFGLHTEICCDLRQRYELPGGTGNILNCCLLPLGVSLSQNIYLWGFDGRAPDDKFFWSNSNRHSYGEFFDGLVAAHPAFFNHHVPQNDPTKYIREVHGDYLDNQLEAAERRGMRFTMMHFSWTETLNKRFSECSK